MTRQQLLDKRDVFNMVHGVTKGYERNMEITGVGYKAAESLLTRARVAFRDGFALVMGS